jgi:multiple sugar transport system permease protein
MAEVATQQGQETARKAAAAAVEGQAPPPQRGGRPSFMKGQGPTALLFLSPTLVVFTAFILFPILFSFYLSFHEWNMFGGDPAFVGVTNYGRMFGDPEFWQVFGHTVVYTLGTVPLNMAVALGVAFFLNKQLRGRKLLRAAFFTPVIISSVAAAVIWRWIFDPNLGLFNVALDALGLPTVNWVNDPTAAMASLIIVGVWKTFGINMVLFAAGLAGIPEHYYEAADIDGASGWDKFWRITVPLLSPTTSRPSSSSTWAMPRRWPTCSSRCCLC